MTIQQKAQHQVLFLFYGWTTFTSLWASVVPYLRCNMVSALHKECNTSKSIVNVKICSKRMVAFMKAMISIRFITGHALTYTRLLIIQTWMMPGRRVLLAECLQNVGKGSFQPVLLQMKTVLQQPVSRQMWTLLTVPPQNKSQKQNKKKRLVCENI